jgi:hypothetical protein
MSSRKNGDKNYEYTDEDFNGINSLLRAAENLEIDRKIDIIDVDKILNETDRQVIKEFINSHPLTNKQMIQVINNMRMSKMPLLNNSQKQNYGGKRRNKTRGKSRRRTRKSRKQRRTRK